jgi:hypothetical protein
MPVPKAGTNGGFDALSVRKGRFIHITKSKAYDPSAEKGRMAARLYFQWIAAWLGIAELGGIWSH